MITIILLANLGRIDLIPIRIEVRLTGLTTTIHRKNLMLVITLIKDTNLVKRIWMGVFRASQTFSSSV